MVIAFLAGSVARTLLKRAGLLLWLLAPLTLSGQSPSIRTTLPPETGHSHLLYLKPEPHRSLYVEVDSVKGAEPSETELSKLTNFLHEWCEKPDGITVVRSSVIGRSAARGNSAVSLARQYMDGPGMTNAAPPAYLYVLFYDNRVNRNPLQSPRGASQWPTRNSIPPQLARPENPHMLSFPYPAMIYVDRSWMGGLLPEKYKEGCSLHEAGHILGLVSRESRVDDFHCGTEWCCMASTSENVKSDLKSWLKREKPRPDYCEGCAAELRQSRTSTNSTSLRFIGPVMVRTMPLYQVLSLPGFCGLYIVNSVETELQRFIEEFRSFPGKVLRQGELRLTAYAADQNRDLVLRALEAAKEDPAPAVRQIAQQLENKVRSEPARPR